MRKHYLCGFTLIELLVSLSMGAILLTLGVPGLMTMLNNNRMATQTNELISTLNYARSEAVKRGGRVTVCKVSGSNYSVCNVAGSWDNGWIIFDDSSNGFTGNPSTVTPVVGSILRVHEALANATVTGNTPVSNYVSFVQNGTSQLASGAFQAGTITICPKAPANGIKGRSIVINSVGRAVVSGQVNCP